MKTLVLMNYGSHLYGTATPESDTDIKGVFLPSFRDLLLTRTPRHQSHSTGDGVNKNTKDDRDEELYSLHYFVEMACQGETVAIDMLHAPPEMLLESSPTWLALRSFRSRFYTKNLKAFVGYARRQASKYGVKGSRLASARTVEAVFAGEVAHDQAVCVAAVRDRLADMALEHVHLSDEWVEVCGKKFQWNARVSEYLPTLRRFVTTYGDRARQAELNQGIDWKAVSHAFRAAYEVRSILVCGDLTFPLVEAPYLLEVKKGLVSFADASKQLESLMDELEGLAAVSALPSKVDREWVDNWLLSTLEREYGVGPLWRDTRVTDLRLPLLVDRSRV